MSLQVDDGGRRGRSRSPSGRERERSRSRNPPNVVDATPYPEEDAMAPGPRAYDYEPREDRYSSYDQPPRSPVDDSSYRRSRETVDVKYSDGRRDKEYRYERASDSPRDKVLDEDRLSFLPQKYAKKTDPARDSDRERDRPRDKERSRKERYEEDLAYGSGPPPSNKYSRPESPPSRYSRPEEAPSSKYSRPEEPSSSYAYAQPKPWEYAKTEEHASYRPSRDSLGVEPRSSGRGRSPSPGPGAREKQYRNSYAGDGRESSASLVTVEPGAGSRRRDKSPQPPMGRDRSPQPPMARDRSPQPPVARMSSLSVNTGQGHGRTLSLSAAPASPLLESYHGTYQSMSPMPSPMLLPSQAGGGPGDSHILDVSPVGSEDERSGGKKQRRRARFTDPEDDASRLAKALKGHDRPDTQPLIEILPGLTHEQVMELRTEYKRLVKTGPDRKGVNIAKHIRARLKDEDPNLMKACYATALGKWESEAYWANFWYQGDKTRRELLIESLMGRSNDEIRMIKDGFSDKKYDNSLTKCMKTELKEDKFKRAVLLVLDEQRMEDMDRYGRPLPLDGRLIEDDVRTLRKAVKAEKGGESAMISIVVQRSDSHLREVLKLYNADYGSNFARDALKKSGNLVGELLAHILNGVINKPVRDALLLHHAVTASKRDELRRELLISRLIRFHWDGHHMAAIKAAYRERYGKDLQEAVRDATSGSGWGEFCRELCITRMPDDVRRVERISSSRR